jgi:hypothetical protein
MYGYDYTPATEGIVSWLKNIVETVGRKINEFTTFIRNAISSVGKTLRGNKDKKSVDPEFAANERKAEELIVGIGDKTRDIITTCSTAINNMYAEYIKHGNLTKGDLTSVHYAGGYNRPIVTAKPIDDGNGGTLYQEYYFDPTRETMQKGARTSDTDWNAFQERFGKLFTSMHKDAEDIRKDLTELQSMPALSYQATLVGYKHLRYLYDANGRFGREWSQLKTAHEFANEGKIKIALGKIVSMYDAGVNAGKAFAKRLVSANFKNDSGSEYNLIAKSYNKAKAKADFHRYARYYYTGSDKSDFRKNGGPIAAKPVDKNHPYRSAHVRSSVDIMEPDEIDKRIKDVKESAMLSNLYDIAYEDAKRDFEMRAQYISAFESVPDAFESF